MTDLRKRSQLEELNGQSLIHQMTGLLSNGGEEVPDRGLDAYYCKHNQMSTSLLVEINDDVAQEVELVDEIYYNMVLDNDPAGTAESGHHVLMNASVFDKVDDTAPQE